LVFAIHSLSVFISLIIWHSADIYSIASGRVCDLCLICPFISTILLLPG